MAVGAARETFPQRRWSDRPDGLDYTRAFLVDVTAKTDNPLTAASLPIPGEAHPQEATIVCDQRSATLIGRAWEHYVVVCTYVTKQLFEEQRFQSAQAGAIANASNPSDPSTRAVQGNGGGGSVLVEKVMYQDVTGKDVLNSAGEPFVPMPTGTIALIRFSRRRTFLVEPINMIASHAGKCNDAVFHGFPAFSVVLENVRYIDRWQWLDKSTGRWVYDATFDFLHYPPRELGALGVETQILDAGYKERVNGELRPILIEGIPSQAPYPLKDGRKNDGPPEYLKFRFVKSADFNALGV